MVKSLIAVLLSFFAALAIAATDVNKATQAELETISGIGPSMSTRILDERKNGAFKNWNDLTQRVKGIGDGNSKKFSSNGLTVAGAAYDGTAFKRGDGSRGRGEGKAAKGAKGDKKAAKEAAASK